jgi:hypothetical protein
MASERGKKLSDDQKLAQQRRALLQAADAALGTSLQPQNAADVYLALISTEEDLQDLRAAIVAHTRQSADKKRFWTAFGVNTPVVAGLLLLEPVSGTLAILATVVTGYTPTVLIKRMLDDYKVGDAAAAQSVSMDIETIDIVIDTLKERRGVVADLYAKEVSAATYHRLFKHFPELKEVFLHAAQKAAAPPASPEQHKAPLKKHRGFGA